MAFGKAILRWAGIRANGLRRQPMPGHGKALPNELHPVSWIAQVQYATDIARQLGIPLPPETLRFRGSMGEFIDRFAEILRQKRRGHLQDCWAQDWRSSVLRGG